LIPSLTNVIGSSETKLNNKNTIRTLQAKKNNLEMFESLKYLTGSAGASGYGSKSTGEQVTENCGDLHSITAIITGEFVICLLF
jgi:hypothetical protein